MQKRKVLWFGIAFSTVAYLVLAYVLYPNPEGGVREKVEQPLVLALYVLAAVMFVVASVLPQRLPGKGQSAMVLAMALYESCAVFGLVAAFLKADWRLYLAPWALALIGFMRVFPNDEALDSAAPPDPR